MNIKELPIKDITPYDNNPRINDDAVGIVVTSIKEFGFQVPIIVDKNNVIVAGHTRYRAAQQLGMQTILTLVAENLTETQVKAFRIMDNKAAEASAWNVDKLLAEIGNLEDLDCNMDTIGFNESELAELYSDFGDGDRGDSEPPQPPTSSQSQRYELDDDERGDAPNFNPTLNPTQSNRDVTERDLEKAKSKLDISQGVRNSMEVICPHCYAEFEVGV